jgi:hypothetical protein
MDTVPVSMLRTTLVQRNTAAILCTNRKRRRAMMTPDRLFILPLGLKREWRRKPSRQTDFLLFPVQQLPLVCISRLIPSQVPAFLEETESDLYRYLCKH